MQDPVKARSAFADLRWDDLRVLLALARERRLKGAGKLLNVNASTVSRRLEILEDAIGTPLFDRLPSGLAPTVALEELLPQVEAVESAVEAFVRTVAGFETEPEGTVRITAPPGVAEHFVTHWVGELRAQRAQMARESYRPPLSIPAQPHPTLVTRVSDGTDDPTS